MRQRGEFDRRQIIAVQPAPLAEYFRQARQQRRVRFGVAFDPVGFFGELEQLIAQRLLGGAKDQAHTLYWYQRSSSFSVCPANFSVCRNLSRSAAHEVSQLESLLKIVVARTDLNPL